MKWVSITILQLSINIHEFESKKKFLFHFLLKLEILSIGVILWIYNLYLYIYINIVHIVFETVIQTCWSSSWIDLHGLWIYDFITLPSSRLYHEIERTLPTNADEHYDVTIHLHTKRNIDFSSYCLRAWLRDVNDTIVERTFPMNIAASHLTTYTRKQYIDFSSCCLRA